MKYAGWLLDSGTEHVRAIAGSGYSPSMGGMTAEPLVLRSEALEEIDKLRVAIDGFRKDAERYRHAKAHGWPMSGPQCIAWTHDGRMVLGDSPEETLDAAMKIGLIG